MALPPIFAGRCGYSAASGQCDSSARTGGRSLQIPPASVGIGLIGRITNAKRGGLFMGRHEYGGLTCQVVNAPTAATDPTLAVVLCHGYGAPADDLVPIGAELLATDAAIARNVRLYFPAAP